MNLCAMIGCKQDMTHYLSIGPGAYIGLCQEHFTNIEEEISDNKSRLKESTEPTDQGGKYYDTLFDSSGGN